MTERKSSFKRAFRNDVRHFRDILIIMIAWVVPLPKMPPPRKHSICWLGDPEPNLHLPLLLGRGTTQIKAPKVWKKTLVLSYFTFECEGGWVAFGPYACLGQDCSKDAGSTHTHTHTLPMSFRGTRKYSVLGHSHVFCRFFQKLHFCLLACWNNNKCRLSACAAGICCWTSSTTFRKGTGNWGQGREFWELQNLEGFSSCKWQK